MTLFRSELLPFHPPRYRSRIGHGLSRYGRAHGHGRSADDSEAPCAQTDAAANMRIEAACTDTARRDIARAA